MLSYLKFSDAPEKRKKESTLHKLSHDWKSPMWKIFMTDCFSLSKVGRIIVRWGNTRMWRTPRRMSFEMVRDKKQHCSLYNTQEHSLDRHVEINVNMLTTTSGPSLTQKGRYIISNFRHVHFLTVPRAVIICQFSEGTKTFFHVTRRWKYNRVSERSQ